MNDLHLSPEMAKLLARLNGITGRLETAVQSLEDHIDKETTTDEDEDEGHP